MNKVFYDLKPGFSCKSISVNVYHLHQFIPSPNFHLLFVMGDVDRDFETLVSKRFTFARDDSGVVTQVEQKIGDK